MGDPVTTSLVLMGSGTLVSAYGSLQQGAMAKAVGDLNADAARRDAEAARERAGAQAAKFRIETRKAIGAGEVAIGAGGVAGSPMDALREFMQVAERDALAVEFGGQLDAQALERQARGFQMEGQAAKQASYYSAAGELLSGAGQMFAAGNKPKAGG